MTRAAHSATAALAWVTVLLTVALTALDAYPPSDYGPGLYGGASAGLITRLTDVLSYFTIWSNIMVAVACTTLAAAPGRDAPWRRALRLSSLLMITVTAIVYATVLAPAVPLRGWHWVTNPLQHIAVPAVTLVVWAVWGPRGWVTWRALRGALLVPAAWVAWIMARGAVTGTYPYGFTNGDSHE